VHYRFSLKARNTTTTATIFTPLDIHHQQPGPPQRIFIFFFFSIIFISLCLCFDIHIPPLLPIDDPFRLCLKCEKLW